MEEKQEGNRSLPGPERLHFEPLTRSPGSDVPYTPLRDLRFSSLSLYLCDSVTTNIENPKISIQNIKI